MCSRCLFFLHLDIWWFCAACLGSRIILSLCRDASSVFTNVFVCWVIQRLSCFECAIHHFVIVRVCGCVLSVCMSCVRFCGDVVEVLLLSRVACVCGCRSAKVITRLKKHEIKPTKESTERQHHEKEKHENNNHNKQITVKRFTKHEITNQEMTKKITKDKITKRQNHERQIHERQNHEKNHLSHTHIRDRHTMLTLRKHDCKNDPTE